MVSHLNLDTQWRILENNQHHVIKASQIMWQGQLSPNDTQPLNCSWPAMISHEHVSQIEGMRT